MFPSCETVPALKVMIVDDHAIVRAGMTTLLQHLGGLEVVAEAGNGQDAVRLTLEHQPELIFIDLRMPIMGGIDAIRKIRSLRPNTRFVILTACSGEEDVHRGIEAGANGYLLKDASPDDLRACIRHVMAGSVHFSADAARALAARISTSPLTPRELEILNRVAVGEANKFIAFGLQIGTGTVKAHVESILGKLGANSRTQAVAIAQRRGLIGLS